jgi:hypothetical protein
MSRLLLVLVFGTASGLIAADFSGRWAGTAGNADGQPDPIYLTVNLRGEAISGNLVKVEPKVIPLSSAVVRNDELHFTVIENDGQLTE